MGSGGGQCAAGALALLLIASWATMSLGQGEEETLLLWTCLALTKGAGILECLESLLGD